MLLLEVCRIQRLSITAHFALQPPVVETNIPLLSSVVDGAVRSATRFNLFPSVVPRRTAGFRSFNATATRNNFVMSAKERVAIIGSGNWGSACAILVGRNVIKHSERFEKDVKMWVFDEQVVSRSQSSASGQNSPNNLKEESS